ncbi:MAG: hypothetical protein PF450_10635 [Bacteroidales bacterium]|jgi:3-isopropylmalate/(R)-2-methylmalate dehydratase small subunit|nr:hypothetical protein [Bacteroidales bacterium]
MKNFNGKVLLLDRSDINTDEIIPAKYLTENSKEALKPYLLEDLVLDDFNPSTDLKDVNIIITRENFGCGSSREHAPWALEVNDINVVVAESFARIFRQNMYNCGMMAVELPKETIDRIFNMAKNNDVSLDTDFQNSQFIIKINGEEERISFEISGFDKDLVNAGGWVDYADKHY